MQKLFTLFVFIFTAQSVFAGKISGTVTDEKGNPLGFASISIKGSNSGAIANAKGFYELHVDARTVTLICQHVGYKAESRTVTVENNLTVDFVLTTQQLSMEEVVIKKGPDPAIEIIRNTIRKREYYNNQVDSFMVDVYIKSLIKTRSLPRMMLQDVEKDELEKSGFDSLGRGILFLSESNTKVSFKKPNTYKYEVLSSRQAGGGYGLSFPVFINFYVNNVQVFENLNPRGFVSPIADGAFNYYKFHYEGSFFENDKMIDRILVTPKRKNEPLFQGYIQIVDGEWRIHSFDLLTTKDYQLQLIDTARLTQIHAPVSEDIWKTQNQVIYIAANTLGFQWTGNILNVYTDYNLNPGFGKKYFTRTIMTYDTAFNKKDSTYWNATRPVPLEMEEKKDFVFKDSLYKRIRDSFYSKSNVDSMNQRRQPVSLRDILLTGVRKTRYSQKGTVSYQFDPLIRAVQYNTVEGLVPDLVHRITIDPRKSRQTYQMILNTRYGFSNEHFNSALRFIVKPKENYLNKSFELSGGKRVSQFNPDNPIDPFLNTTYTLFRRKNYMKIYENWFGEIKYQNAFENGLGWNVGVTYEDRIPLQNTTDYSMGKKSRIFLPNHPFELQHIPFEKHQAMVATIQLSFQPGQRYIQFPANKIPIGSPMPRFELSYSKGLKGVLNSDVDFDKWKFTVSDELNLKLRGELRYRIGAGGFLNARRAEIPDFTHFTGNQVFAAQKYLNAFQLAPYYLYSNTEKLYGVLHVEHHFNGLLTNKIPLFNKLKWNLVAGTNVFYVNQDNYYLEAFAGIENILKLFRIDFVAGYQAMPGNNFGVRLGLGGILGDGVKASMKN